MITCVTHSKTKTLKGTGSPCHYIFYLVEDGPLCRHRIRAKRVIFDIVVHFNFIIIMCNLFFLSLSSVIVSYRGSPGYICLWKTSTCCLRKSSMRSSDIARICRGRLSIGNLPGHTPCVLYCVPSRATSRPTA